MTYLNAKKYILSSKPKQGSAQTAFVELLTELGNPAKRLKYMRFIGSNGKSVCAEMLGSILTQAEYRVGCLRLPMREELRENITVCEKMLSMDDFARITDLVRTAASEKRISVSPAELLMCVALLAFKEQQCEICIIECDSTSVDPIKHLPPPMASVICGTVSSTDTALLAKIPQYICRGTGEVICSPQNNITYRAISDACYMASCRLTLPAKNALEVTRLSFRCSEFTYKDTSYSLGLCGRFQIANAVLVIETAEMLARRGLSITHEHIKSGLSRLKIPAKLEVISISPLIIVDSTHDTVGVNTVCDALCDFKSLSGNKIRLCLPQGEIGESFRSAFECRDYVVEKSLTLAEDTQADNTVAFKTHKQLVRAILSELERDTVLFVSGDFPFVSKVRYEMLAQMGF